MILFDPTAGVEACLQQVKSLPTGNVWQRVGTPTKTDTRPEILDELAKTQIAIGKPVEFPTLLKSVDLGPTPEALVAEAIPGVSQQHSRHPQRTQY